MFKKAIIVIFLLNSLNLFSNNIRDYIKSGNLSLNKQNYYEAIDFFKDALKINSDDLDANIGLSDSFYMIGEYSESLIYIDHCLKLTGDNLGIINRKGRIFTALEMYDDAKKLYDYVLEKEIYNVGARSGLAELRVVAGDIKGSLYDFEKVLKFSPESRRLLLSVAVLYNEEKEFKKAEDLIQRALRLFPGDPIVLEAAVKHYMESKKYSVANLYMGELSKVTDNITLLLLKAELQIYLEDYNEAVKTLSSYIKRDKNSAKSYYLASVALSSQGKEKQALSLLKRALDLRPDEEIYRFFKESLMDELYTVKDENRGEYSKWYLDQGKQLEQRFYYEKSKTYYQRGLDLEPLSTGLRYSYAQILKKIGYKRQYLKELQVIVDRNEDVKDIKEELMIEKSLPLDAIYEKWGDIDFIKNRMFTVSSYIDASSKESNLFSSTVVTNISRRFLSENRKFINESTMLYSGNFSKAYSMARKSESDYFLIISFNEGKRTFSLKAELYLTKNGRMLKKFNYLKTGNNRILNCFDTLSRELDDFFPTLGLVKEVRGNEVLIDLGFYYNVSLEDKFRVLKKDSILLIPDEPYVTYSREKYLGDLVLKDVGESMSWGDYSSSSSFNLLNIGDIVLLDKKDEESSELNLEPTIIDSELIEQLLQVN